jgi:hypothetical protein
MAVSVAEYFGQRTDVDEPTIIPVGTEGDLPICPFTTGNPCKKIRSGYAPVCCVRKSDGTLWINCPDRLCATKTNMNLCQHQINILLDIAKHLFSPNVTPADICVKRETRLTVTDGTKYNADYIICTRSGRSPYSGPDRLILEMQGGGETSNTGNLTEHMREWAQRTNRDNAFLRATTDASTLETNAWRRQQEQFIVKGNIAMKTWKGYGIAFCVGTLLYDYLLNKLANSNLPNLREHNWTLALIAIKENTEQPSQPGPISICVDETRMLFTNYQTFVQALINQGEPSPEAFRGDFIDLNNEVVNIPNN